jgi:hypothetical protein
MNEKLTGNDAPEMRVLIDNLKKQAELLYTQANRFHNCTTLSFLLNQKMHAMKLLKNQVLIITLMNFDCL